MSPSRREPEIHEIEEIEAESLLRMVDGLLLSGWRLVQILALSDPEGYELDYSFGGGYALRTYRIRLKARDPIPSITAYYPSAVLYENEIRELYGVRIERVTPDWHGDLLGAKEARAFSRVRADLIGAERPQGLDSVLTPEAPKDSTR